MNSSPPSRASRSVSRSAPDNAALTRQQLVADAMTQRVVDVLEAVEVDEKDADAMARCASPARWPASAVRAAADGWGAPSARRASPGTAGVPPPGSATTRPARTTGSTRCGPRRRAARSDTTRTRSCRRPLRWLRVRPVARGSSPPIRRPTRPAKLSRSSSCTSGLSESGMPRISSELPAEDVLGLRRPADEPEIEVPLQHGRAGCC